MPLSLIAASMGPLNVQRAPASQSVAKANNSFGVKLLAALGAGQGENTLISPISVSSNLRLLLAGTQGSTYKTLAKTLELSSLSLGQILSGSRDLSTQLSNSGDAKVTIANSLWLAPRLVLSPSYQKVSKDDFEANSQPLQGVGETGAAQINRWVSDHTRQRITQLFSTIPSDSVLVLANAVTFDGQWQDKFLSKDTHFQPFHGSKGDTTVKTMTRTGAIESASQGGAQFIRLPYHGHFSLWIALPGPKADPGRFVKALQIPPKVSASECKLFLPKFSFSDEHQLKAPLSQLGMGRLFVRADFTGISPDPRLGRITEVVHKTFIKVDEEGTEAAAATGAIISPTAIRMEPKLQEIRIDHPFALAIRDDATGTILFEGVVRNLN